MADLKNKITKNTLDHLSEQYGGAFYLLDSDSFENNYRELSEAFKRYYPKFNIAYSYKTNYIPKLVKIVDRLGGYAEVVSDMECEIALRCGISLSRIIWNGPVKNWQKVKELLLAGGTVNLDSADEIEGIRKIAEDYPDNRLNVGIRCNYDVGDGVLSRFGFDIGSEEFDKALNFIASTDNVNLMSLHAHFAKRSPEFWTARANGMLDIYDRVVKQYSLKPERLDIGGGIYGKMPDTLRKQLGVGCVTYDDYASRAAKIFAEHFRDTENPPYLFIEPGSALAGDCMKFVGRVETVKKVRGKTIVTVFGSQKNISMSGVNPPMTVVPCGKEQEMYEDADIAGYTCIESDFLYKGYSGKLTVGDYVVIDNCGSYSIVMKPPFIMPDFPVIDICGDKAELIKRKEEFDDIFHTYNF